MSFRLRPEKVSRDVEQDERAISKAMQRCNRRRDRCRASNRYWIYFFDFIPMRRSRGGDIARRAYSEITYVPFPGGCSSFGLLPVLRRRSRSFVRLSSSRRSFCRMLLFSRTSPLLFPQINISLPGTSPHFTVKYRRCSFLKRHVLAENIVSLPPPSIILRKSFINMVYTPSNPQTPHKPCHSLFARQIA